MALANGVALPGCLKSGMLEEIGQDYCPISQFGGLFRTARKTASRGHICCLLVVDPRRAPGDQERTPKGWLLL